VSILTKIGEKHDIVILYLNLWISFVLEHVWQWNSVY